jgi:iron complex outermembrane receptor protein
MKVMKTSKPLVRAVSVRVTPVAAAVATALGSFCGISLAADDTATEQNTSALTGTDEIVVTATRRDTSVQEVPYNLSALSGAEIEALRLNDLSDIARVTPGLIQVDQGNRDANRLIMRGINASGMEAPERLANSTGGKVSTYFGETPVYIDLQTIDLDRVEVLRGPQGTLYGARSMGGSLRYIPKEPDLDSFSIDMHAQSYGMDESDDIGYNGDITVNMPLIEDTLALRAVLGYMKTPGFIDQNYLVPNPGFSCPDPNQNPAGCDQDGYDSKDDVNDEKTKSARLSLLWNVNESWDALFNFQYQDQDTGGRQMNSRESFGTGKYENAMRFTEEKDRQNRIYNATFTHTGEHFDFVSSSSYTDYSDDGQRDQTDILLDLSDQGGWGYEEFPAFVAYTDDERDDTIFTQEFRLVSNDDENQWDWVAGAYYSDADLDFQSTEFTPELDAYFGAPGFSDIEYHSDVDQNSKETALFGELGYQLTDKLHILGGMRWFKLDDDIELCEELPLLGVSECNDADGDDDDVLFKLNASYQFQPDLLGYAMFSQGYSEGGINVGQSITDSERLVDPESVDNYELGLRSQFLDGDLTINGAVFYMDWHDLQLITAAQAGGFTITSNGGGAETKGIELDATWLLGEHWVTQVGYAYTKAELTEGCSGADLADPDKSCALVSEVTADGDRLPGTPKNQGSFLLGYHTAFQNGWDFSADYRFVSQSDVLTQLGNGDDCCRASGEKLAGFTTHYARISLSYEHWEIGLFADNFTNKYAETGVRDTPDSIRNVGTPDFAIRRYSSFMITPRTIGLDLRYRYGGK